MLSGFRIDLVDTGLFKLKNRKQFHCCDTQLFQIRDLFAQAEISPFLIDFGTGVGCITPNMEFVDDRFTWRKAELFVVTPVKIGIIDNASPVTNCQSFRLFLPAAGIHHSPLRST